MPKRGSRRAPHSQSGRPPVGPAACHPMRGTRTSSLAASMEDDGRQIGIQIGIPLVGSRVK
jgi:hypothetical protein